jgi:hypothetical protein
MARPTKYNPKLANRILDLYSSGKTLQTIEKQKGIPSRRTIATWRTQYPEFGKLYDTALLAYSECIIEEALQIADTETDAKKAKNRIDIRTWIASKYNRPRFGDKLDIQHNVTLDISDTLLEATQRMQSIGTGIPPLLEAKTGSK